MVRMLVLFACAAACGRIGFGPSTGGVDGSGGVLGDGGVPNNEIGISLFTDGDGGNLPIPNASVLIDRGSGTLERVATSEMGAAVIAATSPTRIVVVYSDAANSWRVIDMDAIAPGTVVHLGERPTTTTNHGTTWTLPASGGSLNSYQLRLPLACGYSAKTSGTAVQILYVPECEGRTVHVLGEVSTSTMESGFDAGTVTLTNGGTGTLSGSYLAGQTYTFNVSNIPAAAAFDNGGIFAELAVLDPDLGDIAIGEFGTQTVTSTSATLAPVAEPLGNAFTLGIDGGTGAYQWSTQTVTSATITPTMSVDAGQLLPIITALSLPPSANKASWTLSPATSVAPVMFAYEATITAGTQGVRWTAYRGGTATSLQFPQLPADLAAADPTNGTWGEVTVEGIAFPGATYSALISTVDRDWRSSFGVRAGDGFSSTTNYYTAALGPP